MSRQNRRSFLTQVGSGMLVASVGYGLAMDMGLSPALADDGGGERLTFGSLEPLVDLMCKSTPEQILPTVMKQIESGVEVRRLVAAAALANARAFGGEDYIGFHTLMAMDPAIHLSGDLPEQERLLPILKVIHRNSRRLGEWGGTETLHVVNPTASVEAGGKSPATNVLKEAVHQRDVDTAERLLCASVAASPADAYAELLETVEEGDEVHRVVLAHRAWDMLALVGHEQASTMLRQSLRYCIRNEEHSAKTFSQVRTLLPKLCERIFAKREILGARTVDDEWVTRTSLELFRSSPQQAAEIAAGALLEGISPDAVGEAVSLCANEMLLRDKGREGRMIQPGKPEGSVHGDSIGLHACDSMHAWRGIAKASTPRHTIACLILAAYQTAQDRSWRDADFQSWQIRPFAEDANRTTTNDPKELVKQLDGAIRENDQNLACAITHRYWTLGHDERPVWQLLATHSTMQDGALHAEKFYRTVRDEYARSRTVIRSRQVVALSRVVASGYGFAAPGYDEAKRLLKLA